MKILIAREYSGIVRDAFAAKGHDAWSCDLLPTESPGNHIIGDATRILDQGWDLMIAHPPCTHLAVSGAAWFEKKRKDGRQQEGIDLFLAFANTEIPKVCIENPVGIMSTVWRKPDQTIQPYYFGDEAQKTTHLWLKNLPPLIHIKSTDLFDNVTHSGKGEFITLSSGKKMAKWNGLLSPGPDRGKIRSKTFQGIANAMAEQWG